jgi:hypothetical protein
MAIARRNIRGLQDIRTRSGNVDRVAHPYMAYMKITCLEMEKARRGQERESAIHRVNTIDARFKEIEDEKSALLQALGERNSNGASGKTARTGQKSAPRRSKGPFRIRY